MKIKFRENFMFASAFAVTIGLALTGCSGSGAPTSEAAPQAAVGDEAPEDTYGDLDAGQEMSIPEGITVQSVLMMNNPTYLGNGVVLSGDRYEGFTFDLMGMPAGFLSAGENEALTDVKILAHAPNQDYVLVSGNSVGNDLGKGGEVLALLKKSTGEVLWTDALPELEPIAGALEIAAVGPAGVFTVEVGDTEGGSLAVRSIESGEVLATHPLDKLPSNTGIIVSGDPLTILGSSADGAESVELLEIDAVSGEVISTYQEENRDMVSAVASMPFVIEQLESMLDTDAGTPEVNRTLEDGRVIDDSGDNIKVTSADGSEKWSVPSTGSVAAFNSQFALISVSDKEQFALLRTENGELLGTLPYDGEMYQGCKSGAEFIEDNLLTIDCGDATAVVSLKF